MRLRRRAVRRTARVVRMSRARRTGRRLRLAQAGVRTLGVGHLRWRPGQRSGLSWWLWGELVLHVRGLRVKGHTGARLRRRRHEADLVHSIGGSVVAIGGIKAIRVSLGIVFHQR